MKILIITDRLSHYRVTLFEEINKLFNLNLTICCSESNIKNDKLNIILYKKRELFKSFYYSNDKRLDQQIELSDIIICHFNLRFLYIYKLLFFKNKKVILWGIGLSSDRRYGEKKLLIDYIRILCAKKAAALIFYSKYPISFYENRKVDKLKIFYASNTIYWDQKPNFNSTRKNILFIGSLYVLKRVDKIIWLFKTLKESGIFIPNLLIIGKGDDRSRLEQIVKDNGLINSVHFLGEILDPIELQLIYDSSIICISPGQAGLGVLQSMAAGVPFVTSENAITGGEKFFIVNGVTGILYNNTDLELLNIIQDSIVNKDKYLEMGKKAREEYENNYTLDKMLITFNKCIDYVNSI